MPAKPIVLIATFVVLMVLVGSGVQAQQVPPVDGGTQPGDNAITCEILLEDTTDPLTEAIDAQQTALFGTGGSAANLPFADAGFVFLFEAYTLLNDSMFDLDRVGENIVDMSVAECITADAALAMVDDIHGATGKVSYLLRNLEFVDAVVYSSLLRQAIALEKAVLQQLIGPVVLPTDSTSSASSDSGTQTPATGTTPTPTDTSTP